MTTLIIVRHGETDWNVEGRWQGQIDVPLNANGHHQAQQMAESLIQAPITAIYSSDLRRASETAGYLARKFNLPVQTDARLREIHQGMWQGLRISEIRSNYRSEFQSREKNPLQVAPPGGETVQQVGERLNSFLADLIPSHPHATVAIATHGFVMALLQILLNHEPFENIWQAIPKSGAWLEYQVSDEDLSQISSRLQVN